jgi:hypothetical protein
MNQKKRLAEASAAIQASIKRSLVPPTALVGAILFVYLRRWRKIGGCSAGNESTTA